MCSAGVPDTRDVSAAPPAPDADLRAENAALSTESGRLREAKERLRLLLEDKDAKITDLEKRLRPRGAALCAELGELLDATGHR